MVSMPSISSWREAAEGLRRCCWGVFPSIPFFGPVAGGLLFMATSMTFRMMSTGIAKPIPMYPRPAEDERIAVFIPTT